MAEKPREGVPALKNDEVTGMTQRKQKQVIRESARAAREEAAKAIGHRGKGYRSLKGSHASPDS
jgi:hypothetical protein